MDLSQFDTAELANAGAVLELRGPTGEPLIQDDGVTPVSITLLGEDSDVVTKANNIATNQFLRAGPNGQGITAEISKANEIAKFAKATVEWSGIVVDKKPLECTPENAKALYRRFPWIRDQVRAFIADRANFLKASLKS